MRVLNSHLGWWLLKNVLTTSMFTNACWSHSALAYWLPFLWVYLQYWCSLKFPCSAQWVWNWKGVMKTSCITNCALLDCSASVLENLVFYQGAIEFILLILLLAFTTYSSMCIAIKFYLGPFESYCQAMMCWKFGRFHMHWFVYVQYLPPRFLWQMRVFNHC